MSATFVASATREGRWWIATVDGIGVTQARRLGDVRRMAAELVAVVQGLPVDEVRVEVVVRAVGDVEVADRLASIRAGRAEAARLERDASIQAQALARDLVAMDVPLRDVGAILGVSHQRVHQLAVG
ncbi:hypothetical protein [Cellulomonas hominis]